MNLLAFQNCIQIDCNHISFEMAETEDVMQYDIFLLKYGKNVRNLEKNSYFVPLPWNLKMTVHGLTLLRAGGGFHPPTSVFFL